MARSSWWINGLVAYIKNSWYMAAWSSEIEDKPFGRNLLGERVVMFRDGSGDIHALNAMCSHRNADLSAGTLVGEHIQCPFHGWQYDTRGICRYIPSQPPPHPVYENARVPCYAVKEQHGIVWIWMGDEGAKDERLPGADIFRDETVSNRIADTRLQKATPLTILENALDETHPPFVHTLDDVVPTQLPRRDVRFSENRRRMQFFIDETAVNAEYTHQTADKPDWRTRVIYGTKPLKSVTVGFDIAALVYFLYEHVNGEILIFSGMATPSDDEHTWFFSAFECDRSNWFRNRVVSWYLRVQNDEDETLISCLQRQVHVEDNPHLSVPADHPGLSLRRLYGEWLQQEFP